MSIFLLRCDGEHPLSDDLESLFWVLTYVVLRYRSIAPLTAHDVQKALVALFDAHSDMDDIHKGGTGKRMFLLGGIVAGDTRIRPLLESSFPVPFWSAFMELYMCFCTFHVDIMEAYSDKESARQQSEIDARKVARVQLKTHHFFESLVREAAEVREEWAQVADGGTEDQIVRLVKLADRAASHIER